MNFFKLGLHSGIFLFGLIIAVFIAGSTVKIVFAVQNCSQGNLNQGLISAAAISGILGNVDKTCVQDPQAAYRDFNIPTYDDLEKQFYTLSRSAAKKTAALNNGDLNFGFSAQDGIYLQPSNMIVSSAAGSGMQIIFVRGILDITGNIGYAETGNPAVDPVSGLVFIASGDINIGTAVTKVNAVLISAGTICDAMDFSTRICNPPHDKSPAVTSQLIVNGSLITLNKPLASPSPLPSGQSKDTLLLRRNLANNNQPAEVINKQPKYLYLLRNGLFTKDMILTTEDKNYTLPNYNQPVNGGWSVWFNGNGFSDGAGGTCSVACGGGTQSRICSNPTPAYGGANCSALDGGNSSRACNVQACACPNNNPLVISTVQSVDACIISI